jgi:hypothetical protein
MSITTIGSTPVTPISSEKTEGSGPDNDGDADDTTTNAPVQAAATPGTGTLVDKTA